MTAKKKTPAKGKKAPKAKKSATSTPGKAAKKIKAAKKKTVKKPKQPAPVYEHVFDNPKNVKRLIHAVFVICTIVFVLDFFVDRHINHPWESFTGFYGIFGFVAFVALVLSAKELRKLLMRGEDYYDE